MSGFLMDLLMLGILILFAYLGVRKGAAKSVVVICSFFVTIILFALLRNPLQNLFMNMPFVKNWIDNMTLDFSSNNNLEELADFFAALDSTAALVAQAIASFVISIVVFVVIYILSILVSRLAGGLFVKIMDWPYLRSVNKTFGFILGVLKGAIAIWIVMAVLVLFGISENIVFLREGFENGLIAKALYSSNILIVMFKA